MYLVCFVVGVYMCTYVCICMHMWAYVCVCAFTTRGVYARASLCLNVNVCVVERVFRARMCACLCTAGLSLSAQPRPPQITSSSENRHCCVTIATPPGTSLSVCLPDVNQNTRLGQNVRDHSHSEGA